MIYIKAVVMKGIPEDDYNAWQTRGDYTHNLCCFHDPDNNQYVIDHDYTTVPPEEVDKLKTAIFTEEGGV